MIMPVISVNVCGDDHLEAFKGFCHLQSDLVDHLGSGSAIGLKGLYILFKENAVCFVKPPLGCHKLMVGALGYTVLSADQLLSIAVIILVYSFLVLHHIVDNAFHCCCGLCFLGDCGEYRHQPHLLRISESCSITPECRAVRSLRSGQCILPIRQRTVSWLRLLPIAFCSRSTSSKPLITVTDLFKAAAVTNSVKFLFALFAFRLIAL